MRAHLLVSYLYSSCFTDLDETALAVLALVAVVVHIF